ncbi:gluconeogenesis factor YvcK family protein [Rubeoparvulum massiliense]|uniref:gluconeogenesis factor YvcK family protein n=1 Tax=Rubeoparvulum massiliense TaxID=1631346 RepID=UPI00065DC030|nr:YvcK family protein [Rubeoparvulum massiliense]
MEIEKQHGQPNVVVLGGGTGLPVVLRGLKTYPLNLTAIVTVADDGGSSGKLREEMNMLPPGDIRNVLVALADMEPLLEKMIQHRFNNGSGLSGHTLGNLIIAALTEISGDFVKAVHAFSHVFAVAGNVLPVSEERITLVAEMMDGRVIRGESKIPHAGQPIRRVYLEPRQPHPLPDTIQAIEEADLIVISPGSLYTSTLPTLMVPGVVDAMADARAKVIYVCNVMTQPGETDGFTVSRHLEVLYEHLQRPFVDAVLVNKRPIPDPLLRNYLEEGARPVPIDQQRLVELGVEILYGDLVSNQLLLHHDPDQVGAFLYNWLRENMEKWNGE